jgi:hypothetical protein
VAVGLGGILTGVDVAVGEGLGVAVGDGLGVTVGVNVQVAVGAGAGVGLGAHALTISAIIKTSMKVRVLERIMISSFWQRR